MLKCASVFTLELDELDIAYGEIMSQIDSQITLLDNTIGIVLCHHEFVLSEMAHQLCEKLPFDVVGITTASQSVNGISDEMVLTIFIMTADDVVFKSGVTDSYVTEVQEVSTKACKMATEGMEEAPKLALLFPPLSSANSGDIYTEVWSGIFPGVPIFGSISIDDSVTFQNCVTLYNGKSYKDAMPFVLCYGNISPRFSIVTPPETNIMPFHGQITKSEGPVVREIDDVRTIDYFDGFGFGSRISASDSFMFLPFRINMKSRQDYDGVPVVRGLREFMEDGSALFLGDVDQGSDFTLSKCSSEDLIENAKRAAEKISDFEDVNGVLSFSCTSRRIILAENPMRELEVFREEMKKDIPYMIGYSGGEICPTSLSEMKVTNRFHNFTLASLIV